MAPTTPTGSLVTSTEGFDEPGAHLVENAKVDAMSA